MNEIKNKVEFTDSCWLWHGKLNKNGYGVIQIDKKNYLAHRISYQLFNTGFNQRLGVLHRCDVRNCINPKHLFTGTQLENNLDAAWKNRIPFSEKHWNCKLTKRDVINIKHLAKSHLQREIANAFCVSRTTISSILIGKSRKKDYLHV